MPLKNCLLWDFTAQIHVEKNGTMDFFYRKTNIVLNKKGRNYIVIKLGLGRQTDERGQTKLPPTDPNCNANYPERKFQCVEHERFLGIMIWAKLLG
jgi:hypothetical protein